MIKIDWKKYLSRFFLIGVTSAFLIVFFRSVLKIDVKLTHKVLVFFEVLFLIYLIKEALLQKDVNKTPSNKKSLLLLFNIVLLTLAFFRVNEQVLFSRIIFFVNFIAIFLINFSKDKKTKEFDKKTEMLLLASILGIFTFIKAPYFQMNFTGNNTMKYNTYVEPAKFMLKRKDPFLMEKRYRANPINNRLGVEKLTTLPLIEWGLAASYSSFWLWKILFQHYSYFYAFNRNW